jgi:hypothetical protein
VVEITTPVSTIWKKKVNDQQGDPKDFLLPRCSRGGINHQAYQTEKERKNKYELPFRIPYEIGNKEAYDHVREGVKNVWGMLSS